MKKRTADNRVRSADTSADGISKAIANRVMNGRGQATDIVVDARQQTGITEEIAERGNPARLRCGQRNRRQDHVDPRHRTWLRHHGTQKVIQ